MMELMVVMAVMAIALTTCVSGVKESFPRWRTAAAAYALSSAIKGARSKAILDGSNAALSVDVSTGRYTVPWGPYPEGTMIIITEDGVTRIAKLPTGVEFTRPDGENPVIIMQDGVPSNVLEFDPSGILLSDISRAFIHVGDPTIGLYLRVKINLIGTVSVQKWTAVSGGFAWK
jgi:Tfp pilus assembly protein FimT